MRKLLVLAVLLVGMLAIAGSGTLSLTSPEKGEAATIRTKTVRWGPFTVPGGDGTHEGGGSTDNLIQLFVEKPCSNCYILGITPNAVWADTGQPMNFSTGGMLHHVVLTNLSRNDPTCARFDFDGLVGLLGERIFASGNERTIMNLPSGYGYYVGLLDSWGLIVDLMNHGTQPRQAYVEFTFTYVNWSLLGGNPKSVRPIWFDIDNCGDSEVDLPQNYSDTHADWQATFGGKVIAIGGHVHEHGISIALQNASNGQYICTSVAGYPPAPNQGPRGPGAGTAGHPTNANIVTSDPFGIDNYRDEMGSGWVADMTICNPNISFSRNNVLRVHTQYHNGSAHAHHGQMGIMIAYVQQQ